MEAVPLLPKKFYKRDPADVVENLLGMVLFRVIDGKRLSCRIVEAEAYYGLDDPASRAGAKISRRQCSETSGRR